ncbi:MAG: 16S rRNA (guanine(527)-N(7))-methyltransferase RsmG [Caulobacteraceae bacterium]
MSDAARRDAPPSPAALLDAIGWTPARAADLEAFRLRLEAANGSMNLVGAASLADFRARHFLDSAQLLWFAPGARTWADLGAGAGFPGLILAILLKGAPGARVHLVESVAKKCRFLAEAAAALDLPAEVHNARAETLALRVEVVTARACAPLGRLLAFARPTIEKGARALFLKGEGVDGEIVRAHQTWRFHARTWPSLSDPRGRVLEVSALAPARG